MSLSGALWVSIVLNPTIGGQEKTHLRHQLEKWVRLDVCPLEDPDFRHHHYPHYHHHHHHDRRSRSRRRHVAASEISSESEDENSQGTGGGGESGAPPGGAHSARPPILGPDPSAPPLPPSSSSSPSPRRKKARRSYCRPRTIFHKALDAARMDWENPQLKLILTRDANAPSINCDKTKCVENGFVDENGHLLWHGNCNHSYE